MDRAGLGSRGRDRSTLASAGRAALAGAGSASTAALGLPAPASAPAAAGGVSAAAAATTAGLAALSPATTGSSGSGSGSAVHPRHRLATSPLRTGTVVATAARPHSPLALVAAAASAGGMRPAATAGSSTEAGAAGGGDTSDDEDDSLLTPEQRAAFAEAKRARQRFLAALALVQQLDEALGAVDKVRACCRFARVAGYHCVCPCAASRATSLCARNAARCSSGGGAGHVCGGPTAEGAVAACGG